MWSEMGKQNVQAERLLEIEIEITLVSAYFVK